MTEAFLWGLLASFSLIVGAVLSLVFKIKQRLLGLIMAFGVGVLISAVAYELVEEAFRTSSGATGIAAGLAAGALVFFIGDTSIDHMGGGKRKQMEGAQSNNSALAILLGTILDGIPESIVVGLTLVHNGAVSAAMVVAVFLSNLPEAIATTTGLRTNGWKPRHIFGLWTVVVAISALAALAGYVFFDTASPTALAFTLSFAAGALLTMIADTMMPEAYKDSGKLVGLVTTLGFGLAFAISTL